MSLSDSQSEFRAAVAKDLESPQQTLVELKIFWKNTLIRVVHLDDRAEFVLRTNGSETMNTLRVASSDLPKGCANWKLIRRTGGHQVFVAPVASISDSDRESSKVPKDSSADSGNGIALGIGAPAACTVGDLSFEASLVYAVKSRTIRKPTDRLMLVSALTSAILILSVLTVSWHGTRYRSELLIDDDDRGLLTHLVAYTPAMRSPVEVPMQTASAHDGVLGLRHRNSSQSIRTLGLTNARRGHSWLPDSRRTRLMTVAEARAAIGAGRSIFSALTGADGHAIQRAHNPFGGVGAGSQNTENSLGNSQLDDVVDAFGFGGLGRLNVGQAESACGCSGGTIGFGEFGTIGGSADGAGERRRQLQQTSGVLRDRDTHGPVVRNDGAIVCNLQNPEIIRRVVRRHMSEITGCYQSAVRRLPTIEGRMVVRFVLGPNGDVMGATTTEDQLGDAQLATCITSAFSRWEFAATGSVATISYPISLRLE